MVPHPYTATITQSYDPPAQQWAGPPYGWLDYATSDIGISVRSDNWDNNDDLATLSKLREKVAGSGFNAGVAIAELGETLGMIGSAATKIAAAYVFVKKGRLADAARALTGHSRRIRPRKSASSNWLELQYGWLPLISDVQDGAQFLANHLNVPLQQRYVARRARKVPAITTSPSAYAWDSGVQVDAKQIVAYLREKDVATLSGLTDWRSIAWELVPYSFVADWFIPIGSYLAARGLASSLTGTYITTRTTRIRASGLHAINNGFVYRGAESVNRLYISVDRQVSSSLSVPVPQFKSLGQVASWKHCANAVALLVQRHGSSAR